MPILTYPYIPDSITDPKTKKVIGTIYRPKIPIRLSFNHKIAQFTLDCIADSGADFNLFPAQWGEALGINITKGVNKKMYGIGNATIDAYVHRVKLYVGIYQFSTEAHFSYEQQVPLLGRTGFFNSFKQVKFVELQKEVELTY